MRKLLVIEKPSVEKCIKNALANYVNDGTHYVPDEYYFDYVKHVSPMESSEGTYEKDESGRYVGHYYDGTLSDYRDKLELKSVNIPDNDKNKTFLIYEPMPAYNHAYKNDAELEHVDEVVCVCDPDICGTLAFAKYLEDHNLDFSKAKYIRILSFEEEDIIDNIFNETSFQEVFDGMTKAVFGKEESIQNEKINSD